MRTDIDITDLINATIDNPAAVEVGREWIAACAAEGIWPDPSQAAEVAQLDATTIVRGVHAQWPGGLRAFLADRASDIAGHFIPDPTDDLGDYRPPVPIHPAVWETVSVPDGSAVYTCVHEGAVVLLTIDSVNWRPAALRLTRRHAAHLADILAGLADELEAKGAEDTDTASGGGWGQ